MHDCFAIELTGECLKCFIRLTRGVPAVVVQSEALWARVPEIQVRIPSRAMGTFFPHTVSSIFRLSLTHTHTLLTSPWKMRMWKKVSSSRIRSGWILRESSKTGWMRGRRERERERGGGGGGKEVVDLNTTTSHTTCGSFFMCSFLPMLK